MDLDRRSFLARAGLTAAAAGVLARTAPSLAEPATGVVDWHAVRAQFDLSPDWINLGTFYLASHPKPVREAIEAFRRQLDANPLWLEEAMFDPGRERIPDRVKAALARYIGGRPEEIALTSNTTTGLALVYNGLRIRPEQEILVTEHDHYVHQESARLAAEKSGATVRRVALHDGAPGATEDEMASRLKKAITPRTRVVGVTWVHSSTGLRLPVRRLADVVHEANAGRDEVDRCLMVVDGVHGLGAVDEDAAGLGCDFFTAGTHKWLFGPRGTGLVWGRADAWPHVRPTIPTFDAWEPIRDWMEGQPTPPQTQAAWVSPGGFYAYEHQWAVEAAVRFHEELGRSRIAARIQELNRPLRAALATMRGVRLHTPTSDALSAGIVCFEVDGLQPGQVVERLKAKRVLATTTPYAVSYARVSAGIMIQPEDIETALRAIGHLRGGG